MREELKQTRAMKESPSAPEYGSIQLSQHYMRLYHTFYPAQRDRDPLSHHPTPPSSSQPCSAPLVALQGVTPSPAPSSAPSTQSDNRSPPQILPSSSTTPHELPRQSISYISISDSDVDDSDIANIEPRYGPPVLFMLWTTVSHRLLHTNLSVDSV
jgi:hypothetical protein